ncbi:MAG: ABC transporter ATP-binding protein ['Conium maculatum' witches'-broom phytoplasma]|nr:ABC transporter ATP-binding protein ['Conium maculatum' witches'-broom phytoplasma]
MILLKVNNLHTYFQTDNGLVKAVQGVSFELNKNKSLGIIGESGSGKTQIVMSILQLLKENQTIYEGQIIFKDQIISTFNDQEMEKIRGDKIAMIFQDPVAGLNPVLKIKKQIMEVLIIHRQMSSERAFQQALKLLKLVEINDPERVMSSYPYQLSGGMCQRVMIAIALACEPEILIADEPTTAIDVLVQKEILQLIKNLQKKHKMALLFITHDLGVVSRVADNIIVLYKGQIVEKASSSVLLKNPLHPYTKKLLNDFLITSVNFNHYDEATDFYNAENAKFDFRVFKKDGLPDPDLLQISSEHWVRCTINKK